MQKITRTLACALLLTSNIAMAEKCLNPDKGKYADNDRRNADYVECPSNQPANTYGALGAIGKIFGKYMADDAPKAEVRDDNAGIKKKEKGSFISKFWSKDKAESPEPEAKPADEKKATVEPAPSENH